MNRNNKSLSNCIYIVYASNAFMYQKRHFFNKYYLSYDFAENSDSIQKGFEKKTNFAGNDIRAGRVLDILKT